MANINDFYHYPVYATVEDQTFPTYVLIRKEAKDRLDPEQTDPEIRVTQQELEDELVIDLGVDDEEEGFAALAVMIHDGEATAPTVEEHTHGHLVSYGRRQWMVLSESEADDAARDYFRSTLDESLERVPSSLRSYFKEDEYLDDCLRQDGRGVLASHDGDEHEVEICHGHHSTTLLIYRTS